MVITLYGSDSYRRQKKLHEIISRYKEKRLSLDFEEVDAEEEDALERALEFWSTPSLFQDTKLLVVKQPFAAAGGSDFKKFVKNAAYKKDATLVLSDTTDRIRQEFSFLKEEPNLVQEFPQLEGAAFTAFIREEIRVRGFLIERDALEYLSRVFHGDSWGVVEELSKLSLLEIFPLTLALLKQSGVREESDFFSCISGWFRKRLAERLYSLEELFNYKTEPAQIFNVLAYQDRGELRRFADFDVEVKSGRLEYEEVLIELALLS